MTRKRALGRGLDALIGAGARRRDSLDLTGGATLESADAPMPDVAVDDAMAERLEISASYLNLIERNRRPLTARIVLKLVDTFQFDPRVLNQDEAVGGVDGMRRRLTDARFADLAIDREDIAE